MRSWIKTSEGNGSVMWMCLCFQMAKGQLHSIILVNLTQNRVKWEKRTPAEELSPVGRSVAQHLD